MKEFELEIITPENTVFKGRVSSVVVPADEGYLGIMAGHASFIGSLRKGKITLDNPGALNKEYFISDGFVEIYTQPFDSTRVTILAENILTAAAAKK